ncbi:hypothetical protein CHS0354_032675 [Potamilus streckersoni]|uniref:Uncharacterized protein n=1 Tax=Potamilus streckersoni TaxID=2493646 RepID=A0AAE0WBH1_9BIVA|nr:hypothetical protein CHS0354_032675 [Potamilus streckersoni]
MLKNRVSFVFVAIAIVIYSNPVQTVAQDNNDLVTAASPSETIHHPEKDTTENVDAVDQTDAPISNQTEELEQMSTMASPAGNNDNDKSSQSEASINAAMLQPIYTISSSLSLE